MNVTKYITDLKQAVITLRSHEHQLMELGLWGLVDQVCELKYKLIRLVQQLEESELEKEAV